MAGQILVAGGAGFIGGTIAAALASAERNVIIADHFSVSSESEVPQGVECIRCDCADRASISAVLKDHSIDTVINTATRSLPYSLQHPYEAFHQTLDVVQALCEEQRAGGFRRLIHFSSSEVYGSAMRIPIQEDHPINPMTPYAAAKAACDHLILSYIRTFGTQAHILRPFNQFGPRQRRGQYAALISRVIDATLTGKEISIHGNGEQTRDFLFVENLVPAVLQMLDTEDLPNGESIQIAAEEERTILDVIHTIFGVIGTEVPVRHEPQRPGDVQRQLASSQKARDLLSWEPFISFEEGIERTVAWHKTLL